MIFEEVYSSETLRAAWEKVRSKNAGPGIDRVTIAEFDRDIDRNIITLQQELRNGSYKPMPVMVFTKRSEEHTSELQSH